jgi:hypothetical protein
MKILIVEDEAELLIAADNKIYLRRSHMEEFERLNNAINNRTDKLRKDYCVLKEFSALFEPKRICEIHNLDIHYHKNDYHCFSIKPKS